MEKYWKPALLAGVIGGIVSAIPILGLANCCCLWIIATVVWAEYMYKNENGFVDIGPGAALGAITGGVMGIVDGFLSLIVWAIFGNWYRVFIMNFMQRFNIPPDFNYGMRSMGTSMISSITGFFVSIMVGAIIGLIMGAIWKKPTETGTTSPVEPSNPPVESNQPPEIEE